MVKILRVFEIWGFLTLSPENLKIEEVEMALLWLKTQHMSRNHTKTTSDTTTSGVPPDLSKKQNVNIGPDKV